MKLRSSQFFKFWLPKRLIYQQAGEQPQPFDATELQSLQEGTGEIADSTQAQEFLLRNLEEAVKTLKKQINDTYMNGQMTNDQIKKMVDKGMNPMKWHLQSLQNLDLFDAQIKADIERELNQGDTEEEQVQLDFIRETAQKIAKLFGYQEQVTQVSNAADEQVKIDQFGVEVTSDGDTAEYQAKTQKTEIIDDRGADHIAPLFAAIDSVNADWPGWIQNNEVSELETRLKKELINIFSTTQTKDVLASNTEFYGNKIKVFLIENAGNREWGGLDEEKITELLTQIRTDVEQKAEQLQLENFQKDFVQYKAFFSSILPFLDQIADEVPDVQQLAELDLTTIQKEDIAPLYEQHDQVFTALFEKLNARAVKLISDNSGDKLKGAADLQQRLKNLKPLEAEKYDLKDMQALAIETHDLAGDIATYLQSSEVSNAAQEHVEFNQQLAGILTELNNKKQSAKEAAKKIGTIIDTMKKQPDFQGKQDIITIATSIQTMLNAAEDDKQTIAQLQAKNQKLEQQITALQGHLPQSGHTAEAGHDHGHPSEHPETLPKDPIQAALAEALKKSPKTLENAKGIYIVTTKTSPNINFRDLKTGADIGDIPKGAEVEVLSNEGYPALSWTFVKVKYGDKEGLVALSLLRKKEETTQPPASVAPTPAENLQPIEASEKSLHDRYYENLWPRITKNPGLSESEQLSLSQELKQLLNDLKQAEITSSTALIKNAQEKINKFEAQITQKEIEILSKEETYKKFEQDLGTVKSIEKTPDDKIKLEFDWEGWGNKNNAQVYLSHANNPPPARVINIELHSTHLNKQQPQLGDTVQNTAFSIGDVIDFLKRAKYSHKESRAGRPANFEEQGVPPESNLQELNPNYRNKGLDLYHNKKEEVIKALKKFRGNDKANPTTIRIFAQHGEQFSQTPQHYAFELTKNKDGTLSLVDTTHKGLRGYCVPDITLSKEISNEELYTRLQNFGEQIHQNDLAKGVNKILYEYGFNEKTQALWVHLKDQKYSALKNFAEKVKYAQDNTNRVRALHDSPLKSLPRGQKYDEFNQDLKQRNIRPLPKDPPDFSDEIRIYEKFALALERIRALHRNIYTGTETVHDVVINAMRYFDEI